MQLISINIALPQDIAWQGNVLRTSIFKQPVAGPVPVLAEHLAGDGQADLRVHGGRDKAVYAYPQEHWAYWRQHLPAAQLVPGAFGENLTTTGLLETEVRLGDCFRVGTAVLRAIQPRRPCAKLGIRLGRPSVVREFEQAQRHLFSGAAAGRYAGRRRDYPGGAFAPRGYHSGYGGVPGSRPARPGQGAGAAGHALPLPLLARAPDASAGRIGPCLAPG